MRTNTEALRGVSGVLKPALGLALCLLVSGCASYKYYVLQPQGVNQPLSKRPTRINYPPLVYQLWQADHQLIMQINNPTPSAVTLLGSRSYLVAPAGETHPFRGVLIAPNSFVNLAFPPRPLVARAYPTASFGFGFGSPYFYPGPLFRYGWGFYEDPFFFTPEYYTAYPPNYWEWKTGEVRMLLFYQQVNPTNTFEHQFLIERRKVK